MDHYELVVHVLSKDLVKAKSSEHLLTSMNDSNLVTTYLVVGGLDSTEVGIVHAWNVVMN